MSENKLTPSEVLEQYNNILLYRLEKQHEEYERVNRLYPEQRIHNLIESWLKVMTRVFWDIKEVDENKFIIVLPFYDKNLKPIEIELSIFGVFKSKIELKYYSKDLIIEKIPENVDKFLRNMFINIDLGNGVISKKTTYDTFEVAFTGFLQAVILIASL
jgi:hypothetical protein